MNNDLVSVIMPAYNAEEYIRDSIKSVQLQTYPFWELIIVDDCSSDRTYELAKEFLSDLRIHLYKNIQNSGAAISRNYALREAKGRWIAFLDADDVWFPQKLEKQLAFMIEHDYKFTFTDYRIRLNGNWFPYICTAPDVVTKRKLYHYCYFSTITVIYDRTYVGLIQIPDLKKNNDYAMWLRIIEKTNCYRFPQCLAVYDKHENSISAGSKWKLVPHHYLLFRIGMNKSRSVSVFLTCVNLFFGVLKKIKYRKKVEKTNEFVV